MHVFWLSNRYSEARAAKWNIIDIIARSPHLDLLHPSPAILLYIVVPLARLTYTYSTFGTIAII